MGVSTRGWRLFALAGVPLVLVAGGIGTYGAVHPGKQATGSTALAAPAFDQRLILHPQHVRVSGVLTGGMRVTGDIYPGIPGANTLRLTLPGERAPRGTITVSVTMRGMAMVPVKGALQARGNTYSGILALPMFGSYQGTIVAATPAGRFTGTVAVSIPLPRL